MTITWTGDDRKVARMTCDTPGCGAFVERAQAVGEIDASCVHALCEAAHRAGWTVPNAVTSPDWCPAHGAARRRRREEQHLSRITLGQRRARCDVQALARAALDVCDVLAAEVGYEPSEAPRNYLLTLERWCSGEGEAEGRALAGVTAALRTWRTGVKRGGFRETTTAHRWSRAFELLLDARRDYTAHPTHDRHVPKVRDALAEVLDAARSVGVGGHRSTVEAWLKAHRLAIATEAAHGQGVAARAKRKADKINAERALGTLPGMEMAQ